MTTTPKLPAATRTAIARRKAKGESALSIADTLNRGIDEVQAEFEAIDLAAAAEAAPQVEAAVQAIAADGPNDEQEENVTEPEVIISGSPGSSQALREALAAIPVGEGRIDKVLAAAGIKDDTKGRKRVTDMIARQAVEDRAEDEAAKASEADAAAKAAKDAADAERKAKADNRKTRNDLIAKLRGEGQTTKAIAEHPEVQLSTVRVTRILGELGLTGTGGATGGRKVNEERDAAIVEAVRAGDKTQQTIANDYGISLARVRSIMYAAGGTGNSTSRLGGSSPKPGTPEAQKLLEAVEAFQDQFGISLATMQMAVKAHRRWVADNGTAPGTTEAPSATNGDEPTGETETTDEAPATAPAE